MASVLLTSTDGSSVPLANRLALEGHIVKVWCQSAELRPLIPNSVQQPAMREQYDLILFGETGLGHFAKDFLDEGCRVLGGGMVCDHLVWPEYQKKVNSKLLKLPEWGSQEGIWINTEGWFDVEQFRLFNHSLPQYRLMEGDRGPMTTCSGTVTWKCQDDELVCRLLRPLEPLLKKAGYLGPLSVWSIVSEKELFLVDFNPQIEYDTIYAFTELMPKGLFQFLWSFVNGEQDIPLRGDYGISVRMTMPPYPYQNGQQANLEVVDVPKGAEPHVFLANGINSVIGCATARSNDVRELRRRVYRTLRNCVKSPEVQYRGDIGLKVEEQIGMLKQWGWLDA